ncbi:MAG TPA: peptide-methionine (S)-S-oxide reductase MsrA [Ferruginibacter sp.]|nr:peptide-methionine (S)-S-oxide reductase MsrA [Ferruginibacter sp.]
MKNLIPVAVSLLMSISACSQPDPTLKIPVAVSNKPGKNEAVATFAEGCFWHAEIIFQSLAGVRDAVSGYAGGTTLNPTYDEVSTGRTGHAESVQVYYDSTKISFETLVRALFASMDPTSVNRQGNDAGTEYRSIAFYRNDREKKIIESIIREINNSKKYSSPVVTEVKPFKQFFPAEDYHQEYIFHHPTNGYVRNVSIPEYQAFRKSFKGPFKPAL